MQAPSCLSWTVDHQVVVKKRKVGTHRNGDS